MVQPVESSSTSKEDETLKPGESTTSNSKEQSQDQHKSSTPPTSLESSEGRRGRSRTRTASNVHSHVTDLDAEGNAERQCVPTVAVRDVSIDISFVRGYHALVSSFGKIFHVEKRWKLIREMGSGAYGFVMCALNRHYWESETHNVNSSAVDEISGEPVAIKLVTRVTQKIQLAKRALRELTLLRHFSHENITGLIDVDISSNFDEM